MIIIVLQLRRESSKRFHFPTILRADKAKTGLPYIFENETVTYKGFAEFSHEENNGIMNHQLIDGRDYFTNTEGIAAPETTNEAGIIVRKSNVHNLVNTWVGFLVMKISD
jgi:hypothetical protein